MSKKVVIDTKNQVKTCEIMSKKYCFVCHSGKNIGFDTISMVFISDNCCFVVSKPIFLLR